MTKLKLQCVAKGLSMLLTNFYKYFSKVSLNLYQTKKTLQWHSRKSVGDSIILILTSVLVCNSI